MFSKKSIITGISALTLGISLVGAAYAFPMSGIATPSDSNQPVTQAQTTTQAQNNDATPSAVTMPMYNSINQQTTGTTGTTDTIGAINGQAMPNVQNMPVNHQNMTQYMTQNNRQQMVQQHQTVMGSSNMGHYSGMGGGHM